MIISPLKDCDVPWECWRDPNSRLVYFVHSKCASRLYDKLMNKLNWVQTNTQNIDWSNDVVFSFIRNPVIKHRKGIVEFFFYEQKYIHLVNDVLHNPDWLILLSNAIYLDHHSMSIYSMLAENASKVRWIPIDADIDHKQIAVDLLKQYNAIDTETANWFVSTTKVNESTPAELNLFNLLSRQPVPSQVIRYLDYDDILYQHSLKEFS